MSRIDAKVRSVGHGYVKLATWPEPVEPIASEYVVPVEVGAPGWVDIHGRRHELT